MRNFYQLFITKRKRVWRNVKVKEGKRIKWKMNDYR